MIMYRDLKEAGEISGSSFNSALTVVDPYLLVFYRWGSEIGPNMKEKYPKYTALVENLVQLAPVKSTLEIEEIESTL
jgi:glutathione S-transferase